MFARDDCVEAVDECGRWERATILEIESLGYRVGFVGWGKKHDRWAKPTEVREITPVEVCDGRGKRKVPTSEEVAVQKAMARLTAGDNVCIRSDGERDYFEAEVVEVDKFKGEIKVINVDEGEPDDAPVAVSSSQLYLTEGEKEEPVRKRARRKDNRRTSRRDSQQPLASESIVREASEPMIGVQTDVGEENFQCDTEFMTMNRSGLVVEGGGVYKVTDTPVVVGIESVSKDLASGTLIVDNKVLDDVKISAPVNRLSSVASSLCKKDSAYMRKFSILCNGDKLQMAPASVRLSVRKTLLAKSLRKEVQSSLRLTSFRKSFCLGVLSPEFDMSIFNFKDVLKVEYSYAKQNLSCLDSLLGEGWDLQSPNGQCNFVTKLTLKIKDMQLFGKVFTAKCRETLPKNYRSFLSEYDVGPTESGLSEVIAMV